MLLADLQKWLRENIFNDNRPIKTRLTRIWFYHNHPDIYESLIKQTQFINEPSIYCRIYCILNNITEIPKCKCGNPIKWRRDKFQKFCSKGCSNKFTAKTGNRSHVSFPEVREKTRQTNLKKYGAENVFSLPAIQKKIKQTNMVKYGGQPITHPSIKQKYIQTSLKKYGQTHHSKTRKHKQKMLEWNQRNISPEVLQKTNNRSWLYEQHNQQKKTLSEIAYELNVSPTLIWERFRAFNLAVKHHYSTSIIEKEIQKFLDEHNVQYVANNRKIISPKELDIYIPKHQLAIEFDGLYYHSSKYVSKTYHKEKTDLCEEMGIRLFHIYENEWILKKEIWKSMIINALNIGKSVCIGARNTKVIEINNQNFLKKFFDNNHLQGYVPARISIGLQHDDEIISVMQFGNSRFNNKYQYELIRFCTKINTRIYGGASKLFSYFLKKYQPESCITYADRRYSNGELYSKLGFSRSHDTPPNYDYVIDNTIQSRHSWKKSVLSKKLKSYDPNLTEETNMARNGYYRIYNSGQLVFEWKK